MGVDRGIRERRWDAVCITLLTALLAGCTDGVAEPEPLTELLVDGVAYRVTEFAIAESFPVQIGVTVEIGNESSSSRSLTFPDGCVVLMRAYDARGNLAWDLGHLVDCTQALVEVDLSPGETETFTKGDSFFIHKGAKIIWEITETLKKHYFISA